MLKTTSVFMWALGQRQRRFPDLYALHPQRTYPEQRTSYPHLGHPTTIMVLAASRHPSQPLTRLGCQGRFLANRETPVTQSKNPASYNTGRQRRRHNHRTTDACHHCLPGNIGSTSQASNTFRHQPASTKTIFYKLHDIRAVTAAIREIMDRKTPPPTIFPSDNHCQPSDTDLMRSYAIDTLFDSEYYTGDTRRRSKQ